VFVAAAAASAGGGVLLVHGGWIPKARRGRAFAAWGLGTTAPPLLAFALLCTQMEPGTALRGILGPYPFLLNADVWANPFFADRSGLTDPWGQTLAAARWALTVAALMVAALGLQWAAKRRGRLRPVLMALGYLLPIAGGSLLAPADWNTVLTPLPFLLLASVVVLTWRGRTAERGSERWLLGLILTVFSLMLLLKMPLNARVHHYGFAMALPGVMLGVIAWLEVIPVHWKRVGPDRGLFQAVGLGAITLFTLIHLVSAFVRFGTLNYPLGAEADRIWANGRAAIVQSAVAAVETLTRPQHTLVVVPEGAMINFLSRRASSISHLTFLPTDLAQYGEGTIVGRLAARPPDYLMVLARPLRDLREYGCQAFGEDCARELSRWIDAHYLQVFAEDENGVPLYSLRVRRDDIERPPSKEQGRQAR